MGFIEVSVRPYAEECYSGSVGYIEGWYVVPDLRRSGIGRQLVEAGEAWARAQGCREMASDAALDNAGSTTAHEALGYLSVAEIRCFRKEL